MRRGARRKATHHARGRVASKPEAQARRLSPMARKTPRKTGTPPADGAGATRRAVTKGAVQRGTNQGSSKRVGRGSVGRAGDAKEGRKAAPRGKSGRGVRSGADAAPR